MADTTSASDNIYRSAGHRAIMSLKRKSSRISSGYTGRLTIGVQVRSGHNRTRTVPTSLTTTTNR